MWRNEPITQKQKELIAEMEEFSRYPIPHFEGKTKSENRARIEGVFPFILALLIVWTI